MDNEILNYYSKITGLNVSRETCNELESLISMIQEKNRDINIISKNLFHNDINYILTTVVLLVLIFRYYESSQFQYHFLLPHNIIGKPFRHHLQKCRDP